MMNDRMDENMDDNTDTVSTSDNTTNSNSKAGPMLPPPPQSSSQSQSQRPTTTTTTTKPTRIVVREISNDDMNDHDDQYNYYYDDNSPSSAVSSFDVNRNYDPYSIDTDDDRHNNHNRHGNDNDRRTIRTPPPPTTTTTSSSTSSGRTPQRRTNANSNSDTARRQVKTQPSVSPSPSPSPSWPAKRLLQRSDGAGGLVPELTDTNNDDSDLYDGSTRYKNNKNSNNEASRSTTSFSTVPYDDKRNKDSSSVSSDYQLPTNEYYESSSSSTTAAAEAAASTSRRTTTKKATINPFPFPSTTTDTITTTSSSSSSSSSPPSSLLNVPQFVTPIFTTTPDEGIEQNDDSSQYYDQEEDGEEDYDDDAQQQQQQQQLLIPFDTVLLPSTTIPTDTIHNNNNNNNKQRVVVPALSSSTTFPEDKDWDTTVNSLQLQLQTIESEIYTMNNNVPFNINSPRQCSLVLFGQPNMCTDKATLDGIATSNTMAKFILDYKVLKKRISRAIANTKSTNATTQQQQKSNGKNGNDHDDDATDPILLLDTSSFIFRAYHSMPPMHRNVDGMPVGAVLGFCNMLNRLLLEELLAGKQPTVLLCCDAPQVPAAPHKTFRHELYPPYKGHRSAIPVDLIPQFDLIQRAAQAYGLTQIQAIGYEADDVVATLSHLASHGESQNVQILSGDKDLMQLVTTTTTTTEDTTTTTPSSDGGDPSPPLSSSASSSSSPVGQVVMVDPMTSTTWTYERVMDRWGVPPDQLGDVLALAGDAADNVPGVPGIGPKIAAQLIQHYGSLTNTLREAHTIPQKGRREKIQTYHEQALLSRQLVQLKNDLRWDEMQVLDPYGIEFQNPTLNPNLNKTKKDDTKYDDNDDPTASPPPTTNMLVSDWKVQPINIPRILQFYDEMGFVTIKQRLLEKLSNRKHHQQQDQQQQSVVSYNHNDRVADTDQIMRMTMEPSSVSLPPSSSSSSTSADEKSSSNPQKTMKKSWYPKKKMGIPQPDDYKDVPF
jgi:5'-3' exonuclease